MSKPKLSAERARELFSDDPDKGIPHLPRVAYKAHVTALRQLHVAGTI